MSAATYRIVRFYFDDRIPRRVLRTGLTLREAQEHCSREETSSRTGGIDDRTDQQWFDGYEEEGS